MVDKIVSIQLLNGEMKEFNLKNVYFKKIKTIDSEYYSELSHYFRIGEYLIKPNVYMMSEEYDIDEVIVNAILNNHKIEIIENIQLFKI